MMEGQEIEFEWNPERELIMNLGLMRKVLLTIIAGKTPNEIDIFFNELVSEMATYTGYGIWLERQPENHDQTGKPIGEGLLFCIEACCAFSVEALRILQQQPDDARLPYYISRSIFYAGQAYGLAHGTEVQSIHWAELRAKGGKVKAQNRHGDEKAKFLEAYAEFNTPPYQWRGHRWESRADAVRVIDEALSLNVTQETLTRWASAFDKQADAQKKT